MNQNDLLDLIGEAQEEYVRDAKERKPHRLPSRVARSAALAACLAAVLGVGTLLLPRMGGSENGAGSSVASADGIREDATEFMSYAGPIFPLTTRESVDGITAQRELTMDFTPWVPVWYSNEERAAETSKESERSYQELLAQYNDWYPDGGFYRTSRDILVTDKYTLTNTTEEELSLTLLYPFVSTLNDLETTLPTLSVSHATADGETADDEVYFGPFYSEVDTEVYFGSYSGGFQTVVESDDMDELLNLEELTSWTAYKALLEDGTYLEQAFCDGADLSGISVVVYEFSDFSGPEHTEDVPNPSILADFSLDYDRTTILTYGFNGASYDRTAGTMKQGFSIPREGSVSYGESRYLIVLGDDIAGMEVNGYVNGDPEGNAEELDRFSVEVLRYETDLDTVLRTCVRALYEKYEWTFGSALPVDFEVYYKLFCDHMLAYGVLSEGSAVGRYDTGSLEDISETIAIQRVCYLQADITIPAGESVTVSAQLIKAASYDYHCTHTTEQGIYGYDAVTQLGTTLSFTEQTAQLLDCGVIEIVRQSFGFDLEHGVTQVTLDDETEHYYLEVRRVDSGD